MLNKSELPQVKRTSHGTRQGHRPQQNSFIGPSPPSPLNIFTPRSGGAIKMASGPPRRDITTAGGSGIAPLLWADTPQSKDRSGAQSSHPASPNALYKS